ncbi:MAG: hypothetical protein E3K36_08715 [Candidatus Brocadia sp.]|nr:hypothetical protein [Candidatus Brocadia sp.]
MGEAKRTQQDHCADGFTSFNLSSLTVRLGRKQLRAKLKGDKHLSQIIKRVETCLTMIKICPPVFPVSLRVKKVEETERIMSYKTVKQKEKRADSGLHAMG